MTTLLLIRHGESTANVERRHQGHLDAPLTRLGREQAAALATMLAGRHVDLVCSSDLGRALDTAALALPGRPIERDARLRELHVGAFQGLLFSEARRLHPAEAERYWSRDPHYRLPEGESSADLAARTVAWADAIATRLPGATVAAVTHGGNIQCLACHATGRPLAERDAIATPNAGIHRFAWDGAWRYLGLEGASAGQAS